MDRRCIGVGGEDIGINGYGGTGALGWIWKAWEGLGQEAWHLGILGQERCDLGLWVGVGEQECDVAVSPWTQ